MKHIKVKSSSIESIAFEGNILEVKFLHGNIYRYADVPLMIHHAFISSDSHGSFFHKNIKGNFKLLN